MELLRTFCINVEIALQLSDWQIGAVDVHFSGLHSLQARSCKHCGQFGGEGAQLPFCGQFGGGPQLFWGQFGSDIQLFCLLSFEVLGFTAFTCNGGALRTGMLSTGKLAHETKTRKTTFKTKTFIKLLCPAIASIPTLMSKCPPSISA